jgi:type III pantothenate kinase
MILLLDIGNTHTHLGLADARRVHRHLDVPTASWFNDSAPPRVEQFVGGGALAGAAFCSVVPARRRWSAGRAAPVEGDALQLRPDTVSGIGIDYPRPRTIGPDRLANAMAARHHYGAPWSSWTSGPPSPSTS